MEAPAKVPYAVIRAVLKHARDRAISNACGQCSGLRKAMYEREQRSVITGERQWGKSPWAGVAWRETKFIAREVFTKLRWHGDHYAWTFNGMYVGIELDGYMHT